MLYVLKRKDEVITLLDFLEDGSVYQFHQDSVNPELAPLHNPDDHRITLIGEGYERKIDLFRRFQLGEDLSKIKISVPANRPAVIDTKDVIIPEITDGGYSKLSP